MTRNILVGIVVVIVLVAGGWWYFSQSNTSPSESQNPILHENMNTASQAPVKPSTATTQTTSPSPTTGAENWKTYRSAKWGIEFKYPPSFILNTSPNAYWKDFGPYRDGYDFFELVDTQKNCYIGPVKAVGMHGYTLSSKSISANGRSLEVKYWLDNDLVFIGQANLLTPDSGPWLGLNVTSLSNGLIESSYKNASANRTVSESCVKDFETILASVRFTS